VDGHRSPSHAQKISPFEKQSKNIRTCSSQTIRSDIPTVDVHLSRALVMAWTWCVTFLRCEIHPQLHPTKGAHMLFH
jgi:hypothetical protein